MARNPIDMLPSWALLMNLASHSLQSEVPINEVDPVWWNKMLGMMIPGINENVQRMRAEVEPTVPTYYVRYEDLILDPRPVLLELFCFMLDVPSISGTVCEKRINDYCAQGTDTGAVYKMKEARPARNLSRNAGIYTPE